jgi:undecaprenyl-diphosphatase
MLAAAIPLAPGPMDLRLFRALNFDGGRALDAAARLLSSHAFGVACGLGLAVLLAAVLRARALRPIAGLGIAVGLSDFLGSQLVRPLFLRARPCYALPAAEVRWLLPAGNVPALPSLHAANFFALALVASRADRRLGWLAYPLAAAVAWSRVYGGVHWPLDVLAGAAWGTLAGAAAWEAVSRLAAWRRPG